MGYSFWIIPGGQAYTIAKNTVDSLSREHGFPPFEPHITLVGDLYLSEPELREKLIQLTRRMVPFTVRIERIGWEESFFRQLFLRVKQSPPIMEAQRKARGVLGLDPAPFTPHLSLMYGNFPLEKKKKIIETLNIPPLGFECASIHLIKASKDLAVQEWRKIREFPFKIPA